MDEKRHKLALMKFFNKKRKLHKDELEQRYDIRKLLMIKRQSNFKKNVLDTFIQKLKDTRKYKYIVYLDRFVIQDLINNQEEVIVQRFPKENFFNSIYECNEEMKKISNELLDIKYSYLFEYKEIQNYEQDYISIIEPNEQKYELLEKKKEDLKKKQNAPLLDKERKLQEVQLEYKRIQEELKSYEPGEINPKKKIVLKDYIEKQKELLKLKMKHELLIEYDIKETKTVNKELPKLNVEELPPLVSNAGVEEQKN